MWKKFVRIMIVPGNSHTYLNFLDRVVLAHPFWALVTFPVCSSVLSFWTNRTPSTLSSSIFLLGCLWGKPIPLMAQQVCLLMIPISPLLICGCTISSPRESWYRHLQWFFFCCIYTSNIKLKIVSNTSALLISYKCLPSQACPECQTHF